MSRYGCSGNPQHPRLDLVVVDDDEMILEFVNRIVKKTDASYSLFDDPDAAISVLSELSCLPRLLVIDYYMPTMTGVEFLTRLNVQANLKQSSVFLCSSTDPRHEKNELIRQLGVQLIDKAVIFDRNALLDLLGSAQDVMGN